MLNNNTSGAMVFCRDNSKRQMPGKYIQRPKALKPKDKLSLVLQKRCTKKGFRNREQAKSIVEKAKFSRLTSQIDGFTTTRKEIRMYECTCGRWHVTSSTEQDYNAKYEASKLGEFKYAA